MAYNKILETTSEYTSVPYHIQLLFDLDNSKFQVKDVGIGDGNSWFPDFNEALSFYRALVHVGEEKIRAVVEGSA